MGTAKRERQKANRQRALVEAEQSAGRPRDARIALIVGGAVAAVCLIGVSAIGFVGDDEDDGGNGDENGEAVAAAPAADVPLNPDEVVPDGCPPIEGTAEATQQFSEAPPMCLDDAIEYTALIETNVGSIEVDLDPELAPGTVNSFVFLARNRFFDDTVCHRIIQEFVVQCGDPTATGTGGPGYSTLDELPEAGQYEVGSFAMANSGPDTQGSQFFIITGDQGVALPPAYSLFGSVGDADLDVVAEMNARGSLDTSGTPSEEVRLVSVRIATA